MNTRRVACFATLLVTIAACADARFVDRVVLINETDYPAKVEVRGETRGWLGLTTVSPDSTTAVEQVIDQGDKWTFRFSYGVHDPVEIALTRRELAEENWRVNVPTEFEQHLIDEEATPPP